MAHLELISNINTLWLSTAKVRNYLGLSADIVDSTITQWIGFAESYFEQQTSYILANKTYRLIVAVQDDPGYPLPHHNVVQILSVKLGNLEMNNYILRDNQCLLGTIPTEDTVSIAYIAGTPASMPVFELILLQIVKDIYHERLSGGQTDLFANFAGYCQHIHDYRL